MKNDSGIFREILTGFIAGERSASIHVKVDDGSDDTNRIGTESGRVKRRVASVPESSPSLRPGRRI